MMAEDPYAEEDEIPDPAEVDAAAVLDLYDDIVGDLRADRYPPGFRPTLRQIYRELGSARRPDRFEDVPELLNRFPDLTADALSYVAHSAEEDPDKAIEVFVEILSDGRFHREQELLQICRHALYLSPDPLGQLPALLSDLALTHGHPLVRARALLAWGEQSEPSDFAAADGFWRDTQRQWRIYPFVAIQQKEEAERNRRYDEWSSAGRLLDRLGRSIRASRFSWKRI